MAESKASVLAYKHISTVLCKPMCLQILAWLIRPAKKAKKCKNISYKTGNTVVEEKR